MGEHPTYTGELLTIRVSGPPGNTTNFPDTLQTRSSFERDLRGVDECNVGARFAVEVTATNTLNRENYSKHSIR